MNTLYLITGVTLFGVTTLDIIKTTFTSNGGGLITNLVSKSVWRAFFAASDRNGKAKLLEYAGPATLVSVLFVWIVGMWLGLLLMLLSEANSIVSSSRHTPTSWLEKLYYAGFTLSTLGVGDYVATSNGWRIITSAAAFSGLAFITASITYFVPVLSAVSLQSKIGLYITSMGKTPEEMLTNSWNGRNFSSLFDTTHDLCQMIMQHTLNHHSYPIIHYFHNSKEDMSVKRAIVTLDEAHHLLTNAISPNAEVDKLKLTMLRTTLDSYIHLVKGGISMSSSREGKAPVPNLDKLARAGIPLAREGAGYVDRQDVKRHRELLTALLESGGWSWQDVYKAQESSRA